MVKWALQSGRGGREYQESAEQQLWRPWSTTGIQPWANRSPNSAKCGGFGKSEVNQINEPQIICGTWFSSGSQSHWGKPVRLKLGLRTRCQLHIKADSWVRQLHYGQTEFWKMQKNSKITSQEQLTLKGGSFWFVQSLKS